MPKPLALIITTTNPIRAAEIIAALTGNSGTTAILKSVAWIICPAGRLATELMVTVIVFGPVLLNVTGCVAVPDCAS